MESKDTACSVDQLCLTFCNLTDCSPPGSTVHGIFQARIRGVGCHFLLQKTIQKGKQSSNTRFRSAVAGRSKNLSRNDILRIMEERILPIICIWNQTHIHRCHSTISNNLLCELWVILVWTANLSWLAS